MAKKVVTKKVDVVDAEVVSEPPPAPVAVAEPVTPPALTLSQQAEIDRIMSEAKEKAQQVILGGSPEAKLGTPSGNVEETQERYQADHLPGKMRRDKTRVPERIYDEDLQTTREVLRNGDYKYVMIPQDDFLTYTGYGYKFCKYDGGAQSGLAPRGFQGTNDAIFTRTLTGNCQRGDCFLMYLPIRAWEVLHQEDLDSQDSASKKVLGNFHNAGYDVGIRPYAQIDGRDIF